MLIAVLIGVYLFGFAVTHGVLSGTVQIGREHGHEVDVSTGDVTIISAAWPATWAFILGLEIADRLTRPQK